MKTSTKIKKRRRLFIVFIVFLLIITGFLIKENRKTSNINNANRIVIPTQTPINYSLADSVSFNDIVNDLRNIWLYSDTSSTCLLGSVSLRNGTNFLWGWVRIKDNQYSSEPINPGEGPTWNIELVNDVRWSVIDKTCRVGIEMDLSENARKPKHVWYILDFQHSVVNGQMFHEKPGMWISLKPGLQLR